MAASDEIDAHRDDGSEDVAEAADDPLPEGMLPDPSDVQATLGNVATGLAAQLSSITEEMNKIRQELYGENGIGGIAKELDKLKAGGLADLLDEGGDSDGSGGLAGFEAALGGLNSLDADLGAASGTRAAASSGDFAGRASTQRAAGSDGDAGADRASGSHGDGAPKAAGGESSGEARRRRTPEQRDRDFEELKKMLARGQSSAKGKGSQKATASTTTMWDKLMLFFLVLVCLCVGSPFFRTMTKRMLSIAIYGQVFEEGFEHEPEEGEIQPDF